MSVNSCGRVEIVAAKRQRQRVVAAEADEQSLARNPSLPSETSACKTPIAESPRRAQHSTLKLLLVRIDGRTLDIGIAAAG